MLFAMAQDSEQLIAMVAIVGVLLVGLIGTVMGIWSSVAKKRIDAALKSDLLARGMTADEIVAVIQAQAGESKAVANPKSLAYASEAVVERDEEWHQALILTAADGAYFVHFVGESMDENEWVSPHRIRFPAGSPLTAWPSWVRHFQPTAAPLKEPMEAEL